MVNEEIELCRRWREEGDAEALNELHARYAPMIRRLARKAAKYRRGVEVKELEQVGVCGLMNGLLTINLNRKDGFRRYIIVSISTAIWNSDSFTGGVPRRQSEHNRRIYIIEKELRQELQREPTEEEVARRARLKLNQVRNARAARATNRPEQPPEAGLETFVNDHPENPEDAAIKAIDNKKWLKLIERALNSKNFSDRERQVIILCYIKEMKSCEVAELLCLRPNYVNRIKSLAIKKLQHMLPARVRSEDHGAYGHRKSTGGV